VNEATVSLDEARLRRLIEVGRSLVVESDPEAVINDALEAARELTGARYAALGVLDSRRSELEQFLTRGIDLKGFAKGFVVLQTRVRLDVVTVYTAGPVQPAGAAAAARYAMGYVSTMHTERVPEHPIGA